MPRQKVLRQEMRRCGFCDRETLQDIVEQRPWFYLFFVPLFPVGGARIVTRCRECEATLPG